MSDLGVRISVFTKFFNYLIIKGHCNCSKRPLKGITARGLGGHFLISKINLPTTEPGLAQEYGANSAFEIHIMQQENIYLQDNLTLIFESKNDAFCQVKFKEAYEAFYKTTATRNLLNEFKSSLESIPNCKLLEIGGRERSGKGETYGTSNVTILDIIEDESVDIVGDAHKMKNIFKPGSFNAVSSISVFEHLSMPWEVVKGINHVLNEGGIAYIQSHQTVGMHDIPWDFWRFSDTAWKSLFNKASGFEVIKTALSAPQFIIPFHTWPPAKDAEKACGFLASSVLVKKIKTITSEEINLDTINLVGLSYPN